MQVDQRQVTVDHPRYSCRECHKYYQYCSDFGVPARIRFDSGTNRMQKLTNRGQSVLTWEFLGQNVRFLGIAGRGG